MAYVKTVWETGDVITAEKLNNIEDGVEANAEAVADAFVAPAVTSADEGDVLTVNSSGEWVNAAPAQETLLICGNLTVDMQLAGSFTVVSGDTTHISEYKDIVLRVKVFSDTGADPTFTGDEFVFPLDELGWNTAEQRVNYYIFKRDVTVLGIDATVTIEYATYDGTWSATVSTQ